MKKLTIFLAIFFLALTNISAQDYDGLSFWFGSSWNRISVSHLPEYLRDIPAHKKDGGKATGIITREAYDYAFSIPFDLRYEYPSKTNTHFGFGITMVIPIESFAKRNYTNAPGTDKRGYGAALTFAGITTLGPFSSLAGIRPVLPGLAFTPNFFMETSLKNNVKTHLALGYQALGAINGWDRYDQLQSRQIKVLAHIFSLSAGLKAKFLKTNWEIGPSVLLPIKTSTGREAEVKTSAGLYLFVQMPED
ncbi:MAG: hypothetical protein WCW61_01905 [Patescibacteria group bacterium]|jgi:hypothetical protein